MVRCSKRLDNGTSKISLWDAVDLIIRKWQENKDNISGAMKVCYIAPFILIAVRSHSKDFLTELYACSTIILIYKV